MDALLVCFALLKVRRPENKNFTKKLTCHSTREDYLDPKGALGEASKELEINLHPEEELALKLSNGMFPKTEKKQRRFTLQEIADEIKKIRIKQDHPHPTITRDGVRIMLIKARRKIRGSFVVAGIIKKRRELAEKAKKDQKQKNP
ncbi:hypothetical protein HY994_03265 [Candidatus Micrarchaeota archaeon]|nr:hypothetical protein [Candidatus Micrarchaeota archaeon]